MIHPHNPIDICAALGLEFVYIYPSIPTREFDWGVSRVDREEEGVLAYGATKEAAAWDAIDNFEPEE